MQAAKYIPPDTRNPGFVKHPPIAVMVPFPVEEMEIRSFVPERVSCGATQVVQAALFVAPPAS